MLGVPAVSTPKSLERCFDVRRVSTDLATRPSGSRSASEWYVRPTVALAAPSHVFDSAGWFDAEGTIMGGGRTWDQVRFNAFPSKAAFMAVALDPERLRMQADHRETAIADT